MEFSKLLQQRGGARQVRLAWRILDVERLHDTILDQHGIALRACAEAEARAVHRKPESLGEVAIAIREELDLALAAGGLCPSVHDEDVVDAGHGDRIDALG